MSGEQSQAPDRLPGLGLLVGRMLGAAADIVFARGAGQEAGVPSAEQYWKWRGAARLSVDGRTTTTGPLATHVDWPRHPRQTKPGPAEWLGWTDRLLHPRHLYIWGRPGEDWRLDDVAGWSQLVDGAVEIALQHVENGRTGSVHIAPQSGRAMLLDLPGTVTWSLEHVDESPDVLSWPLREWFGDVISTRWP